jgi:ABC-type nitrate/sulfonate/bicarbonate transport system substrate-binding protein
LAGGGVAVPGLISGSVQYSATAASAMSAIMKGAALKVFLVSQDHPNYQIWSFDPSVKKFEDLKDRPLVINTRGGSDELATRIYLRQKGYASDFLGYIPMGEGPARFAVITKGPMAQRQGILLTTDVTELGRRELLDKGRPLANLMKDVVLVNGGLVATTKELTEHRDRAKAVLRAVRKGMLYMTSFKEGTAEIMQAHSPSLSRASIDANIDEAVAEADDAGDISLETGKQELAARGELLGVPPEKIPAPEQVYDFSLLHEVDAELKTAGWKPSP